MRKSKSFLGLNWHAAGCTPRARFKRGRNQTIGQSQYSMPTDKPLDLSIPIRLLTASKTTLPLLHQIRDTAILCCNERSTNPLFDNTYPTKAICATN